ncbi:MULTISPECIES: ABC transporter ATP-binding protein [unclassified Streptomyces]|uniref:ABC transporter ATP-binding protein n=1 Tax=unclassified Streptomyces TaxID=2593676 RepID=UPI00225BFD40|nr:MULTISPECIES: ABC transporter ATP-binding protein [unclassified Streptomyces]MCX4991629.1 ABC transporter ATP-binding protein [Streptomyces sp. NBC_00568]MCX5003135.1 ABC transporter ATP-binding protein [Streptomyces sp. NBC_00638]
MTTTTAPSPVLEATGVTMRFGGLTAVRNVDLTVNAGEIVGLIGPNGAGKTTFFNCLTGLYVPTEGKVAYKGTVLPPKPHLVTSAGIARTFQNIRLFANMTVLENVLVGRHTRTKEGLWSALLRGPGFRKAEAASRERAMELLEFIGLAHKADHLSRNLPYGEQRKLEIARAMASEPGLLLLDEPTAGMNPQETRATEELVFAIRDRGIAVLVIEHDMRFIFNLSDRVACLVQGEKLVEGTSDVVQGDERVIAAYLGTPFEGAPGEEELAEVEAAEAAGAAKADETPDAVTTDTEEAADAEDTAEATPAEEAEETTEAAETEEAPEAEGTADAPEADDSDAPETPAASDDSDAQGSSTSKEGNAQ